jgi:DNA helicase HerA-like ATPase
VEVAEAYNADPGNKQPPRKLMITIEEAHKFLDPSIAKSTIFGTIAREMRKYFVTLLIVDQRPSGIDNEILSQVGTRITALLNDDKDIDAVFTGVSGGNSLKTVLSQMDPKQQAMILGYAVPMPVVVKTRSYNAEFYKSLGYMEVNEENKLEIIDRGEKAQSELFPV